MVVCTYVFNAPIKNFVFFPPFRRTCYQFYLSPLPFKKWLQVVHEGEITMSCVGDGFITSKKNKALYQIHLPLHVYVMTTSVYR